MEGSRSVICEIKLDIRILIAFVELNCIVKGRKKLTLRQDDLLPFCKHLAQVFMSHPH